MSLSQLTAFCIKNAHTLFYCIAAGYAAYFFYTHQKSLSRKTLIQQTLGWFLLIAFGASAVFSFIAYFSSSPLNSLNTTRIQHFFEAEIGLAQLALGLSGLIALQSSNNIKRILSISAICILLCAFAKFTHDERAGLNTLSKKITTSISTDTLLTLIVIAINIQGDTLKKTLQTVSKKYSSLLNLTK